MEEIINTIYTDAGVQKVLCTKYRGSIEFQRALNKACLLSTDNKNFNKRLVARAIGVVTINALDSMKA